MVTYWYNIMHQSLSPIYPFTGVAALLDLLYISRYSAVRPTLQTTFPHPVLHILLPRSLWLFVPLSRHLPPSSHPHHSSNNSLVVRPTLQTLAPIQSSTSFSQGPFGCSFHPPDTCPQTVLHTLLPGSVWYSSVSLAFQISL